MKIVYRSHGDGVCVCVCVISIERVHVLTNASVLFTLMYKLSKINVCLPW